MTWLARVLQRRHERAAEEHFREALTFRAFIAWRPCDGKEASRGSEVRALMRRDQPRLYESVSDGCMSRLNCASAMTSVAALLSVAICCLTSHAQPTNKVCGDTRKEE